MRNAIIPLLQEYFFEDHSRVAVVLGEPKGGGFLGCRQIKDPLGEGEARDSWIVLPEFAEDAYDRCVKRDTSIHLVDPEAQAAE
jgi:5-methylcytosine-specific restriction protein B